MLKKPSTHISALGKLLPTHPGTLSYTIFLHSKEVKNRDARNFKSCVRITKTKYYVTEKLIAQMKAKVYWKSPDEIQTLRREQMYCDHLKKQLEVINLQQQKRLSLKIEALQWRVKEGEKFEILKDKMDESQIFTKSLGKLSDRPDSAPKPHIMTSPGAPNYKVMTNRCEHSTQITMPSKLNNEKQVAKPSDDISPPPKERPQFRGAENAAPQNHKDAIRKRFSQLSKLPPKNINRLTMIRRNFRQILASRGHF